MTLTLIPHFIHTIFFLRLYDAISCSLFYGRHVFLTSPMCHLHKIKGSVRKHSCSILRGKHDDYGLYYRLLPSALKPRMRLRSCRTMPRGGATVKERKPRTYITPHKHSFRDVEQETGGVKCGISEADLTSWSFLRKFRVRRTLHMRLS